MHRHHGSRRATGRDSGDCFGGREAARGGFRDAYQRPHARDGRLGRRRRRDDGRNDGPGRPRATVSNVIKTEAYGPQIRGGESSCTVRISQTPIYAQGDVVDVLVVFNWADFDRFKGEIVPRPTRSSSTRRRTRRPFRKGSRPRKATWIAGAVRRARDEVDRDEGREEHRHPRPPGRALRPPAGVGSGRAVESKFGKKKAGVLEANLKGFEAGIEYATDARQRRRRPRGSSTSRAPRSSSCRGTKRAPSRPSTPAAASSPATRSPPPPRSSTSSRSGSRGSGGAIVQTEDELSAIGAVVGGVLRRREVDDGHLRPRPLADDRDARPRVDGRDPGRHPQRPARRTVDGPPDEERAVATSSRPSSPRTATRRASSSRRRTSRTASTPPSTPSTSPRSTSSRSSSCRTRRIGQRRETVKMANLVHEVVDRARPDGRGADGLQALHGDRRRRLADERPRDEGAGSTRRTASSTTRRGARASAYLLHEKMNAKRYRKLRPIRDKYPQFLQLGPEKADLGILCWGSSKGPVWEAVASRQREGRRASPPSSRRCSIRSRRRPFKAVPAGVKEARRHRDLLRRAVLQVPPDLPRPARATSTSSSGRAG